VSLELVSPDRKPDGDPLIDRVERLTELAGWLREDLLRVEEELQRLLDYLDVDRLEYEAFKQTGKLRSHDGSWVPKLFAASKIVVEGEGAAKEALAESQKREDAAIEQLDEAIAAIEDAVPAYKDG
jgi:hypothetical protein